jgi:hypothetical protein
MNPLLLDQLADLRQCLLRIAARVLDEQLECPPTDRLTSLFERELDTAPVRLTVRTSRTREREQHTDPYRLLADRRGCSR